MSASGSLSSLIRIFLLLLVCCIREITVCAAVNPSSPCVGESVPPLSESAYHVVSPLAVITANASTCNPSPSKLDNCSGGATTGAGSTVIVLDNTPPTPEIIAFMDSVPGTVFVILADAIPPSEDPAMTDSTACIRLVMAIMNLSPSFTPLRISRSSPLNTKLTRDAPGRNIAP